MASLQSKLILTKLETPVSYIVPDMACVSQGLCLRVSLSAFIPWGLKYYSSGSAENCFVFLGAEKIRREVKTHPASFLAKLC